MTDNRHEELARRLLEEPSSSWPEELKSLRVETRPMPAALRSRLNELARSPQSATEEKSPHRTAGRRVVGIRIPLAAAASLATVVAVGIYLYNAPWVHRHGAEDIFASISYVEGNVLRDNSPVAAGDALRKNETLRVGTRSLAVVLEEQVGTEARLRILPETELKVDALRPDLFQVRIKHGTLLAGLSHRDGAKPSPGLSIVTPTGEALVTGTQFSVSGNEPGDTTLSTYEGRVNFRRRWDALEDLPEELIAQSEVLSETRTIFRQASTQVEAGSQSIILNQDFQTRLRKIPALDRVLAGPSLSRLRDRPKTSESSDTERSRADMQIALKELEEAFPTPEARAEILRLVRVAFGEAPRAQRIPPSELQERRNSLEALSEKEREERYRLLRDSGQSMDRETFRREATRALGKAPQEIIMKNGEHIYGTAFGENGRYRVYTATEIRVLSPEEIEEILFE